VKDRNRETTDGKREGEEMKLGMDEGRQATNENSNDRSGHPRGDNREPD